MHVLCGGHWHSPLLPSPGSAQAQELCSISENGLHHPMGRRPFTDMHMAALHQNIHQDIIQKMSVFRTTPACYSPDPSLEEVSAAAFFQFFCHQIYPQARNEVHSISVRVTRHQDSFRHHFLPKWILIPFFLVLMRNHLSVN